MDKPLLFWLRINRLLNRQPLGSTERQSLHLQWQSHLELIGRPLPRNHPARKFKP